MNEFQTKYIELKKEYERSDGNATSVQALYEYKDYLEEQTDPEALSVLVNVCETLKLYKSAYEILRPLVKQTDKNCIYRGQFLIMDAFVQQLQVCNTLIIPASFRQFFCVSHLHFHHISSPAASAYINIKPDSFGI